MQERGLHILWDVIEEHLDEAGFCFAQWEQALQSPLYTLPQLEKKLESRLLAHLDGLLVAGSPAIDKVLLPALAAPDPGWVFAAAYALASSEQALAQDHLFSHLEQAAPESLGPVQRALELAPIRDPQRILRLLESARIELQALALDVLSFQRVAGEQWGARLPQFLLQADSWLRAAALRAVRRLPSAACTNAVLGVLESCAMTPAAALEAGMVLGLLDARQAAAWLHSPDRTAVEAAQLVLAMVGSVQDTERLRRDTADKNSQRGALFALGFSGSIPLVDHILSLMREPELAALAGEALCGITGVDIEKAGLAAKPPPAPPATADQEPPQLADLDADLSRPPEADLPVPDPDAAAAWWKDHRASFTPGIRYVYGLPMEGARTLIAALALAPMRRRHALALELAMASQGQLQVETRALARAQWRHLPPAWQALARAQSATPAPRPSHGQEHAGA